MSPKRFRDSMADIEVCLRSRPDKLCRMDFRCTIAHSILADANSARNWRIYHDLAQGLIAHTRRLYAHEPFGVELEQTIYALDPTKIDLCLSLFSWARVWIAICVYVLVAILRKELGLEFCLSQFTSFERERI
jgi:hypothetical protein